MTEFLTGDVLTLRCGIECIAIAREGYNFLVSPNGIITYFYEYENYKTIDNPELTDHYLQDIMRHVRAGFVLYEEIVELPTADTPEGTLVIVWNRTEGSTESSSGCFMGISEGGKYQIFECWGDGVCKITEWDFAQIL